LRIALGADDHLHADATPVPSTPSPPALDTSATTRAEFENAMTG
jgi:hypothetical protein